MHTNIQRWRRGVGIIVMVPGLLLSAVFFSLPTSAAECPVPTDKPYKSARTGIMYYVTPSCKKQRIPNKTVYLSHFTSLSELTVTSGTSLLAVPNDSVTTLPWGPERVFLSGSVLKTPDDSTIYLLIRDTLYRIASPTALKELGIASSWVELVTPEVIAKYTISPVKISGSQFPEFFVFRYTNSTRNYILKRNADGRLAKEYIPTTAILRTLYRTDRISRIATAFSFPNYIAPAVPAPILTPAPPSGTAVPLTNASSSLGSNLDGLQSYSPDPVFIDQFAKSRDWIAGGCDGGAWDTGLPLTLDVHGWVADAPANVCPHTLLMDGVINLDDNIFTSGKYPLGTYVIFWEGSGTIAMANGRDASNFQVTGPGRAIFTLHQSTSAGIDIAITNFDRTNYIRNIRVIMPGGVVGKTPTQLDYFRGCATARGGEGAPNAGETCYDFEQIAWNRFADPVSSMNSPNPVFYPKSLQKMNYRAIRFMDWMKTNASPVVTWNDRTHLHDQTMTGPKGIAYEYMMALANVLKADPWFNIPHQATDDYVQQFAMLAKSLLDDNLKVYVEYSNEAFNSDFIQKVWMRQRESELGLADTYSDGRKFFAKRTVEIMRIWSQVYGTKTNHLVRVMGGWAATNGWWSNELLTLAGGNANIDAIAIAPYFGYYLGNITSADEWTVDKIFHEIFTGGNISGEPGSALSKSEHDIQSNAAVAREHNVQLIAYEGGEHITGIGLATTNRALTELFHAANRDPRMGLAYEQYLNTWRQAGGTMFAHFGHMGAWSRYGSWGSLEHVEQTGTPKYDALMRYAGQNPCWWTGCAYGQFRPAPTITPTLPPPTPAPGTIPGLTAYWNFDRNTTDQTGNGYDAVLKGTTDCTAAGKFGSGCFVSNNADGIEVSRYPFLQNEPTGFSGAAWVKFDGNVGEKVIWEAGFENFGLKYFGKGVQKGRLHCIIRNSQQAFFFGQEETFTPQIGTWHHMACVYDRASDTLKLYVDGNEIVDDRITTNGQFDMFPHLPSSGLGIGCRVPGYCVGPVPGWPIERAVIDEVKFYNIPLTPEQVRQLANGST